MTWIGCAAFRNDSVGSLAVYIILYYIILYYIILYYITLYYIILYYIILYYIILYAAVARFALFAWAALEAPLCMPTVCPFGEDVVFIANDWQAPHTI